MQSRTLLALVIGFLAGVLATAGLGSTYFTVRLEQERARTEAAREEAERQRDLAAQERERALNVREQLGGMLRAGADAGLNEQIERVGQALRQAEPQKKQEP
jgi:hypothetical protein